MCACAVFFDCKKKEEKEARYKIHEREKTNMWERHTHTHTPSNYVSKIWNKSTRKIIRHYILKFKM